MTQPVMQRRDIGSAEGDIFDVLMQGVEFVLIPMSRWRLSGPRAQG
jgi:hypothetical protein